MTLSLPTMPTQLPALSGVTRGTFDRDLLAFRRTYVALWQAAPTTMPPLGRLRTDAEQRATEAHTDRFLDRAERELRRGVKDPARRARTERRLERMIRAFAHDAQLMPAEQLDQIAGKAFFSVTSDFLREARSFDPRLAPEDLFQALRNVWIMNLLQKLLDRPVALTPAMVGYSLLYPLTDNWLDDPAISDEAKQAFGERFGRRLAGEPIPPRNDHERAVFALVGLIEQVFPRHRFADVFRSLLAIHGGQSDSLRMHRQDPGAERSILEISLAKGGASVLADGYLVAGTLDRETADFCFGYGAVLQLIDDLQDIDDDQQAGHRTLFAQDTGGAPQDTQVAKLIHFLDAVLDRGRRPGDAERELLFDLIRDNCVQMILFAAARHRDRFRPSFLAALEARALVRFAYAERFARTARGRFETLAKRSSRHATARRSPALR